jgi:large repetitive protein
MLLALAMGLVAAAPAYAMPYVPHVTRPASHATRKLTVKLVRKPAAYVNATRASFSWRHTGTVRSTTCKLDTRKATSCKRGRISYRKLAAGHHTFVLTVRGASSRRTITRRWLIDLDAPLPPTSVLGGSTAWSTVPVTLTAAGGSDATSGLAGYQYQVSVNGGAWRSPVQRNPAAIGVEGSSIVQFRSVDRAGNTSSWVPSVPGPDNTVNIDTTPPAVPTLTGGSSVWQNVASVTVNASGGADGGSGFAHFGYRLSTDGGTTWSTELSGTGVTVPAEGLTLVRFRSYDVAGNASPWATATVMIDRANPTDPVVSGGSPAWQSVTSMHLAAAGSTDTGSGMDTYQRETSTDGGLTWSAPANASSLTVTAQGETLVRFRAVDVSGRFSNWVTGIARIDHTAPVTPTLTGGSAAWQNVASVDVAATGTTDTGGSGFDHLSYRTSTDGGTTWGPETPGTLVTVSSQGATLVQFRGRDFAGNVTPWVSASVKIDRANPTDPVIANSSTAWQSVASINLVASSTDSPGSGIASYQRQVSTDGGASWGSTSTGASRSVTAEGETLVRFRAVDVSGKTSNWVVATARIDRTKPTDPNVSSAGAGWQNTSMLPLSASGSSDSGGSGLVGYQSEMSTNGAPYTSPVLGASVFVTSDGVTVVRFRSIDGAGNTSAWSQVTARLDSSPPSDPTVTGWSPGWVNSASVVVTAAGSADAWSGLGSYQWQTSTDGGVLWSSLLSGNQVTVTSEGSTVVRFRATDNVGNASNWVSATVKIDRTNPSSPTAVAGGSSVWQSAVSVTVTGSGSTDPPGGAGLSGYQTRTSPDGVTWSAPAAGASATISNEGVTYVQVRSVDGAGNMSDWAPVAPTATSTVKIDRSNPTAPTVTGGSATWQTTAPVTVSAAGSTDAGSGILRYEYETSTNGGATWSAATTGTTMAVSSEGQTLVQFRSVDNVLRVSPWVQAQVRIDTVKPSAPAVSGGSLTWKNVAQIAISASGSTDQAGGSGFAGYQYQLSTNGGSTWTAAVAGSSFTVVNEGQTLVQFRSVDSAGNVSAWTPSVNGATNTARIDRSAPSAPTVTGGGGATNCYRRKTVTASGSSDGAGSGLAHYQYRVSPDSGVTWGGTTSASSVKLATRGVYLVQFQAVDNVGLLSAWAPATPVTANTVCIR